MFCNYLQTVSSYSITCDCEMFVYIQPKQINERTTFRETLRIIISLDNSLPLSQHKVILLMNAWATASHMKKSLMWQFIFTVYVSTHFCFSPSVIFLSSMIDTSHTCWQKHTGGVITESENKLGKSILNLFPVHKQVSVNTWSPRKQGTHAVAT